MTEAEAVLAVLAEWPGAQVVVTTQAVVDEVVRLISERGRP